jgi:predicted FMN-binding regulatory protein PaiB
MKFQPIYRQDDPACIERLIRRCRMGLLSTIGPEGAPRIGWTNAAKMGGDFFVHLSAEDVQAGDLRSGPALLSYSEVLATIPSDWSGTEDACMATNLYLHAEFECEARELTDPASAMADLGELMRAYQPSGGHRPLSLEDPRYRAELGSLAMFRLKVVRTRSKWKVGQIWTAERRKDTLRRLRERGLPEDKRTLEEMSEWMRRAGEMPL